MYIHTYYVYTFVIVMKSPPKNTPLTPSIVNNCRARGDPRADIGEGKSNVPIIIILYEKLS